MVPGLSWATIDSDGDGVPDDQDECPQTPPKTLVDKHGCALKGVTAAAPVDTTAPSVKEPQPQKSETEFKPPKIAESLPVTAVPVPAPVKPVVATKAEAPVAAASAVVTTAPSESVQVKEPKKSTQESALSRLARIAEMPGTPSKKKHKKPVTEAKPAAVEPKTKPSQLSALVETPEPIVAPLAAPEVMELPRFLVLNFAPSKAELNADSLRKLDALAKAFAQKLADKPTLKLEIQAHADATEGRRPEEVAQDRANMVRVYLDAQGMASSRLTLLATQVDRASEADRDSRRVEIKVLD